MGRCRRYGGIGRSRDVVAPPDSIATAKNRERRDRLSRSVSWCLRCLPPLGRVLALQLLAPSQLSLEVRQSRSPP